MVGVEQVLVTGATGVVGPSLVKELAAKGYLVRALVRQPPTGGVLPEGTELILGDIQDEAVVRRAVEGVKCIYHLAAKLHVQNPTPTLVPEYDRVNVDGSRRIAVAAKAAGVRRLIYFSTINVYGSGSENSVFDEESGPNPQSDYARTKLEGEHIIRGEAPSVVLRLGAVYGPRMVGNYVRLLKMLRRGRFAMVGAGQNRRTIVHVSDVCSAAIAAAEEPKTDGLIYNVTDGAIHTLKEIIAAMCDALGRSYPRLKLPAGMTRGVLGIYEDLAGLLGIESQFGRETVDKITEDLAVRGDKLQRETPYRPRVNLGAGWRSAIASLDN
jgi:UDP-glucose 4-epimerase